MLVAGISLFDGLILATLLLLFNRGDGAPLLLFSPVCAIGAVHQQRQARLVTVAGRPSATLKPKTEASIPKQAGLRRERP